MKKRTKVSEFSTSELIHMAKQAISCDATEERKFKSLMRVDFTLIHLCNSLRKRKILGRRIMLKKEIDQVKTCKCKKYLQDMFCEIQERYEELLMEERENSRM